MKLCAFDIETSGTLPEYALQPQRAGVTPYFLAHGKPEAWITSCAAAFPNGRVVGKLHPSVENLRHLLTSAKESGYTIVAWNAPFDVSWLIALGLREEVYACKWLDGMLLWRHLIACPDFVNNGKRQKFGLKEAVAQFYPEQAGYEEDIDFHTTDPDKLAKLLEYNKLDCVHTLNLTQMFLSQLTPEQLRAAKIEAQSIPTVAETYVRGITVDVGSARALDTVLDNARKKAFVKLKLDSPDLITPEVLNSPKQLSELLFQKWQLPIGKLSPTTGNPSTDKDALHELGLVDERAGWVRDYREATGNRTKFVANTIESVEYNGDGCTRPQARIYGTYTGRMTYSSSQGTGKAKRQTGVALHQWKRDADFRRLIQAPDGYTLMEFDFAGQEFRWMAVESGDPTMLKLCMPGEDAHGYMGARIVGMDYRQLLADVDAKVEGAKDKRQLGKVANLSLQYRTSANRLMGVARTNYNLDMDLPQAKAIHATYQMSYMEVPIYWKRQIYKARTQGYVQTQAGRRVQLGMGNTWVKDKEWSLESTAINFPIQGVGADQKYLALLCARPLLTKYDARFYFELHDGLFFIVPDHCAEQFRVEMKFLLSNLPYKRAWGVEFPIQFPVDSKMGKSWGDLKEVKDA